MTNFSSFSNQWYHEFIADVMSKLPDGASSDAVTNAFAMLYSAALIAEAIGEIAESPGSGSESIIEAIDAMAKSPRLGSESIIHAIDNLGRELHDIKNEIIDAFG